MWSIAQGACVTPPSIKNTIAMKRSDLLKHLRQFGVELLREGGSHSIYINGGNKKTSAIPRHNEIDDITARNICRALDIPRMRER